ncbi:MAG: cation-translocating P-type ATPase [Traorella sp.]
MLTKTKQEIEDLLETSSISGLTSAQVEERLKKDGYNELKEARKESLLMKFINQFKDTLIIILLVAAIISFLVEPSEWIDSVIILVVVTVNAILGVVQESKAEKSLEALKKMSAPTSKVIRNNEVCIVDTKELVVGDVLVLEAGDCVGSDARIVESYNLQIDESALTGESLAVNKSSEPLESEDVSLGDRVNMAFQSCNVTYGRGVAIVTATGMNNEVGKIAGMLMNEKQELTPLQVKLNEIGKTIGVLCIGICILVFGMEYFSGLESLLNAFKSAIALAVAAIPEGLATVVTIVLALSTQKMVKHHAIIRKLPAVETLGSTSIVCSDKTGTLTQNKMSVLEVYSSQGLKKLEEANSEEEIAMLNYFTLCSDAQIQDGNEIGDPTEVALVAASLSKNYTKDDLYQVYHRKEELSFDSNRKMMSVFFEKDGEIMSITKGGCDVVLAHCDDADYDAIMQANQQMADKALRVLAVAIRKWDHMPEVIDFENVENHLTFVDLVGMIDPPRPEVRQAISQAKQAGVRTIMITGDHITTASAIAKDLGILEDGMLAISGSELNEMSDEELQANIEKYAVYARVAPEHKVRIVNAWQAKGEIVAMTGDGVNDAPALKSADIGCAMGITGTEVAKSAAAMILTDDNFSTIITSIREGRGIFDNIQKDVQYLLSSNVGEVLTIFLASLISILVPNSTLGIPLLPIHLLWVNLITDSLPAFALGLEPTEDDVMERKPRKKDESFFSHGLLKKIIWQGIMIGLLTLISYMYGETISHETGMTMAFVTLSFAQIFHSFNVKSHKSIFNKHIFNNKYLWGSAFIGILLQVIIINVAPLATIFKLVPLSLPCIGVAVGCAFLVIVIVEISKLFNK